MERKPYFLSKIIKSKSNQFCLGLFCAAFIFTASTLQLPVVSSFINQLDNWIYDQFVRQNWRPHKLNPRVVIIDIDNKSVHEEGRWPWPRNKMARLINKLKQDGVVTIGTDIVMAEPEVNYALGLKAELEHFAPLLTKEQKQLPELLTQIAPQVDNDRIFADTLLDHNVILGFLFHNDTSVRKGILPAPLAQENGAPLTRKGLPLHQFSGFNGGLELFFNASMQAGAVTNLPDLDGSVRHGLLLTSFDNTLYPTLSLAVAMNYLLVDQAQLLTHRDTLYGIKIGAVSIPVNAQGQILIPFWGPPGTLEYYSATDVMHNRVDPERLKGAIAIIGSTMILLADLHQSPVAQSFPGVEMVANMVQGIVGQQLLTPYNWQSSQGRIFIVLFGVFFAFVFSLMGVSWMLAVAMLTVLIVLGIALTLFVYENVYVPSGIILTITGLQAVANYSYLFIMERRQKKKINQLFGQYVPEEYVKELIESPDQYSMEGQVRDMTVLFSDIRDFTTMSEGLDASDVKRLLNTFFTPITEIIFSFRGTIDKYVGDMIVAFWGAPIHDEEHAAHAIMAALKMMKQLPEINQQMLGKNLPAVNIGIGLATGLMNVGDMGSEFRRAYTVLGDTVNLASRLQDLTKFYHVHILVSDVTKERHHQFLWRVIDRITVKGRKSGLTIYQPLGMVTEATEDSLLELDQYHGALEDYYAQNWIVAEDKFDMLINTYPGMYLYQMYHDRIKSFKANPPPIDWNGIYVHYHK